MHTSQIKKYLKIIGISSISQFEKHDLDYWWKKKYAQIFESNFEDRNELLINLNNAKENLDNIEYEELLNCYKTNSARNKKEIITKKDNIEKKNPKNSTYYSLHPKKSISDINKNDEKKVYKSEASPLLKNLKRLNSTQRKILELRYGLDGKKPSTYQEIGDLLSYTRNQIRKMESEAIRELNLLEKNWVINSNLSFKSKKARLSAQKSAQKMGKALTLVGGLVYIFILILTGFYIFKILNRASVYGENNFLEQQSKNNELQSIFNGYNLKQILPNSNF